MEYIWILPIAFIITLQISAIIIVTNEDILYSNEEKVKKILFIILVPLIGAYIELRKLDKFYRYKTDSQGNYVMKYSF